MFHVIVYSFFSLVVALAGELGQGCEILSRRVFSSLFSMKKQYWLSCLVWPKSLTVLWILAKSPIGQEADLWNFVQIEHSHGQVKKKTLIISLYCSLL